MTFLLGIDLGTSSVKALIMREDGVTCAIGQQSYDVLMPQPGYAEQETEVWWNAQISAVRLAMEKARISAKDISFPFPARARP